MKFSPTFLSFTFSIFLPTTHNPSTTYSNPKEVYNFEAKRYTIKVSKDHVNLNQYTRLRKGNLPAERARRVSPLESLVCRTILVL